MGSRLYFDYGQSSRVPRVDAQVGLVGARASGPKCGPLVGINQGFGKAGRKKQPNRVFCITELAKYFDNSMNMTSKMSPIG